MVAVAQPRSSGGLFAALAERGRDVGGFTFRLSTASYESTGWAVSIPGHETALAPGVPLTERIVLDYVARNLPMLGRHCLGAWLDRTTNQWYLDITQVVRTRGLAERLGRQYNQLAVYCLDTDETVRLDN